MSVKDKVDNSELLWNVLGVFACFIAWNRKKNVFHPEVLKLYREVKTNTVSQLEWSYYLRLFYYYIYKCDPGMAEKTNLKKIEEELIKFDENKYKSCLEKIKNLGHLTPENLTKPALLR